MSCVSNDDIAAVEDAAASIASATGEPVSVGYHAFTDSIHIVTSLDDETVRAGLPQHLTDRQLTIVHHTGSASRLPLPLRQPHNVVGQPAKGLSDLVCQ